MPWSPVKKFPEIVMTIKRSGDMDKTNTNKIKQTIVGVLGIVKEHTIRQTIDTMILMNYMQPDKNAPGIWLLNPHIDQSKTIQEPFGKNKSFALQAGQNTNQNLSQNTDQKTEQNTDQNSSQKQDKETIQLSEKEVHSNINKEESGFISNPKPISTEDKKTEQEVDAMIDNLIPD